MLDKLEAVEGKRGHGDPAEEAVPIGESSIQNDDDGTPFDGEPVPNAHGAGPSSHTIEPKPYLELMDTVQPLVHRLVEELAVDNSISPPEPSERGGRLSVRQYIRDPDEPFLLPQDDRPAAPTLALRLVIDHSTSMNLSSRIEYAAQAAMLLHLAAVELSIPHQVVVTPDDIRIADMDSGEGGPSIRSVYAYGAGYVLVGIG